MPLDPKMQSVLDLLTKQASLDPGDLTVSETLKRMRAVNRAPFNPDLPVVRTENIEIESPDGPIPARLYFPTDGSLGILLNIHGGGWVMGSMENDDPRCRILCQSIPCTIVSIDYRLAPENKFPAALEDCVTAFTWIERNARDIGIGAPRIAISGSSAGGNLAAATTLLLRDQGRTAPVFQALLYPICDGRMTSRSYEENAEGYFLTRKSMAWFWDQYLSDGFDRENPYLSPLLANSLHGLPPTLVVTAEFDPLRDEGEAYAARLVAAGVDTRVRRYPGVVHGFLTIAPHLKQTAEAIEQIVRCLRDAFLRDAFGSAS